MWSLRILKEMFIPEARFPDEKFWNKDGSPIHPNPKGPPKGTVGSTHRDIGAWDVDDNPWGGQEIYPNINDVRKDHPAAYRALGMLCNPNELPEEAFLYDEDGNITVTVGDRSYRWNGKAWREVRQ